MAINPGAAITPNNPSGGGTPTTAASNPFQTNEYRAITASAGNWAIGDVLTRIISMPATGSPTVNWYKPDGTTTLATVPVIGTDVEDLDLQTLAAIKAGGSSALIAVNYRTVGGTTALNVGYLSQLSSGQVLYTRLDRAATVTIGTAAGNAIASSITPVGPYLISTQSVGAPFATATVNNFTQPAVGGTVAITATLESAAGSDAQFTTGTSIFICDSTGSQVAGHYIIRGGTFPTLNVELQDPLLNNLATEQTAFTTGASVPPMRMCAMAKLTPPTSATHAYLSVTQSTRAIISAIRYADSLDPALRSQSMRDQIQLKRTVAISTKPATLHVDRGPKRVLAGDTTVELGADDIWLYAMSDFESINCTVEWMGG